MTVTIVYIRVKPEYIERFREACRKNHLNSVKEPGNLRFDVLQSSADPSKFVLYEAYISDEAAAAHKETYHYAEWRDNVKDWMAEPRQGVKYNILNPGETNS